MMPGWDKSQDLRASGDGDQAQLPQPDPSPELTQAVADAADRITAARIVHQMVREGNLERLKEKLARAASVAAKATVSIEAEADSLIAREAQIAQRAQKAFAPHHALLDAHARDLDQLEDALKVIANTDPLQGSGS